MAGWLPPVSQGGTRRTHVTVRCDRGRTLCRGEERGGEGRKGEERGGEGRRGEERGGERRRELCLVAVGHWPEHFMMHTDSI